MLRLQCPRRIADQPVALGVDGLGAEASDPTVILFPTPTYDIDADRFELTPQGYAALAALDANSLVW
jgi:hypothetical protein